MNTIKKFVIALSFCFSYIFCVGEAGAIFLLINPGSAAAGVGEAQVARAHDAYSSYYNPAGLAFLDRSQVALQHVNWLPNLTDDIYYEFLAYVSPIQDVGTFGGHIIFLNLGEQTHMGEGPDEVLGVFKSYMAALTGSFGMKTNENTAVGFNFKVFHQKLADNSITASAGYNTGVGGETGDPNSTDFAFDIGYLKKYGKEKQHAFGLTVQNIGPPISFVDKEQADPAPTNMRIGFYTRLFKDDKNSLHLLFDASKLLVAAYPEMDWNEDGRIEGAKERAHTDGWTKAIYTSWLDDWYYGGDLNLCEGKCLQNTWAKEIDYEFFLENGDLDLLDDLIGGYELRDFFWALTESDPVDGEYPSSTAGIYAPNYENFCTEDRAECYNASGQLIHDVDIMVEVLNPDYEDPYCSDGISMSELICEDINEEDWIIDSDPETIEILEEANYNVDEIAWIDLPHDNLGSDDNQWFRVGNATSWDVNNPNIIYCTQEEIDDGVSGCDYTDVSAGDPMHDESDNILTCTDESGPSFYNSHTDYRCRYDLEYTGEYGFKQDQYGVFNVFGNKEKGTGKDRKFSDELKEMIYNFGLEFWYTDNFAMRVGYIYDEAGDIKNPTFGAGVHFNRYGFDFGYTAGDKGHPRANTMFFSLSLGL